MAQPKSGGDLQQNRRLLAALRELKRGEFGVRIPTDKAGIAGQIAETFNEVAELMERSTAELERVSVAVGKEGRIRERLSAGGEGGGWTKRTNAINTLIVDLVQPTEEIARVIGAVKQGDLTQRIALEQDGSPV